MRSAGRSGAGRRSLGLLGWIGAGLTTAGCITWPVGARLDPTSSGIIGEWAGRDTTRHGDSVFWRFRPDGVAETFQLRARGASSSYWQRVAIMRWEVRKNQMGDPRPAVCLDTGGRSRWPSCQLYAIDTMADVARITRRRLTWEGWLGDRSMTTQVFWERRP